MKKETRGRKPIPIIDSLPYSNIVFLVASEINYPEAISKARKTDSSSTVKQLEALKKTKFLNEPKKEKLLNKTIYSVNWKKIIEEFVKYIKENIDYVCSENERLGLNLNQAIKGFEEIIKQATDKNFQEGLKSNEYLQTFFQNYYSEIGRLKENWTMTATFDFLSFFAGLNFIYQWGSSHDFYNIEKVFYVLNQSESSFPDWLMNEDKPKDEKEEFERFKKIHKHTTTEQENLEKKRKEQLKKILDKNKELTELYILDRILQVIKIKPSLQLGLNKAIKETGKIIFKKTLEKEQMKRYFELREKYNLLTSVQEKEIIENDLKEIIGENGFNATKPTENKENKFGDTIKKESLSSVTKKGKKQK